MDVVADGEFAAGSDKFGIDLLNTRQEIFVTSVYSSADEAAGRELNRLCVEEGVIPTCKPGCFHCCGQHILTSVVEAQALAHYIKREFQRGEIEDLRIRTQQWHEWDETRPGRHHATHIDEQLTFPAYHYCPMLVEGKCSAYPMRPLICRTHFVCSDPQACRPSYDPESIEDDPVALASVKAATNPFSVRIRDRIENAGFNFYGSIMLLPHWLAIEMNWDFAITLEFG
jgi:Fe-S-cluster containining protein